MDTNASSSTGYNPFERVRTIPSKVCNPIKRAFEVVSSESTVTYPEFDNLSEVNNSLANNVDGAPVKKLKLKNVPINFTLREIVNLKPSVDAVGEDVNETNELGPAHQVVCAPAPVIVSNLGSELVGVPVVLSQPSSVNLEKDLSISSESEVELCDVEKKPETKKTILIEALPEKAKAKCSYVFVKGPKKGSQCVNFCSKKSNMCAHHNKPNEIKPAKVKPNLEEKVALLEAKVNMLTRLVNKLNGERFVKSKLSSLTKEKQYKVEKIENRFCVVSDSDGAKYKFRIPQRLVEGCTADVKSLRYDETLKTHFWQG